MAAQDLTQLATLKLWLPITSTNTNDDTSIARLITATSMDFQRATKRPDLLQAEYAEVHQGDGSTRMIAFHWPIVAVESLTVGSVTISESEDKIANGWYIDEDIDPERIWNLYLNGYCFTDGFPVALDYTAGYVQPGTDPEDGEIALPEDIEQAVIDWCTYRYNERPNVSATERRSTEGESIEAPLIDAPPNVLSVIERYTRTFPSIDRRAEQREERLMRSAPKSGRGKK
jgi:hypothetical protein